MATLTISSFVIVCLIGVNLGVNLGVNGEKPEEEETYEETRVKLCETLKPKGMKEKFDTCYDKFAPKEIKDLDAECAKLIGLDKFDSYKMLTSKFCGKTGPKDFEKFETCADEKAEEQNLDEKKEEILLKPVLDCIDGKESK